MGKLATLLPFTALILNVQVRALPNKANMKTRQQLILAISRAAIPIISRAEENSKGPEHGKPLNKGMTPDAVKVP